MNIENIDIKDLVLIGGGLFTVAIILHGLWLAWRTRQDPLRMNIERDLIPEEDEEDDLARLRGELPNGGGRVVVPVQNDLAFDEDAPEPLHPTVAAGAASSGWSPADAEVARQGGPAEESAAPIVAAAPAPEAVLPDTGPIVARDPKRSRTGDSPEPETSGNRADAPTARSGDELLAINLVGPSDEQFTGEALLAAIRGQGLKYGEMSIFHRHDAQTGEIQFSVANIMEPGHFDLAEISSFVSPGLVFFLRMPGLDNPMGALEEMIRTTRLIADELGAVLKDEGMSVLSRQTVEHYRERAADYARRRLSRKAGTM